MPLIDASKKNPILQAPLQQTSAHSVSDTDSSELLLKQDMKVLEHVDGTKEYVAPPQNQQVTETVEKAPSEDISANLLEKVAAVTQAEPSLDPPPEVEKQINLEELQSKTYTLVDLLDQAFQLGASDIHLSEGYRAIVRVDGDLKTINSNVLTSELLKSFATEFIANRTDVNLDEIKQFDLGYDFKNRRLRVNIYKSTGSFTIVCRFIPDRIKTVEELELPPVFKELGTVANGLVLVTGPTGSGKSTTIASILNFINSTQPTHLVTLEDPIEFVFPKAMALVDQREFGNDFSDWPNALKALLRQDPNKVLVGEMRDLDTISSTITVAETGHLVFATLHTNSASQSIDRIIDVFPEAQQSQIRAQLSNVLVAVVSQRLVQLIQGGRKAVVEFMVANPAIKNAIREGKTYQIDNMIQTGQNIGMISMEKSLADLVRKGLITVDEARATTVKQSELDLYLKK